MSKKGIDYAWHGSLNFPAMKQAGVTFIARYLSHDAAKNLSLSEKNAALANGIEVAVVWETTASRILSGRAGGQADAQAADGLIKGLGMAGCPCYFACDFDATEGQQATINAYLDGAASVIGRNRTGMYAGYHPIRRAFDAGKITYGWQTYAWSGGNWDSRAQLRQVKNDVRVAGLSCDWDEAVKADYGQWPRPKAATPAPPAPPKPAVPAGAVSGLRVTSAGHTSVALAWNTDAAKTTTGNVLVWAYKGRAANKATLVASYPRTLKGTAGQTGGLERSTEYTVHAAAADAPPGVFASVTFRTG
jgi:hypothetical protein